MRTLFLISCLVLAGCDYSYSMGKKEPAPEIDRYKIVAVNDRTFLLDTVTGKNWRWVRIDDENSQLAQKPTLGWVWEPSDVFENNTAYFDYIRALQLSADMERASKKK